MPYYDLRCTSCSHTFNQKASVAEKSELRIPCPACGSTALETDFKRAPAAVMKSSGEPAACPHAHLCGAACHHA